MRPIGWRIGGIAIIDQAWLSFINFAIAAALINGATKEAYGQYVLLFNAALLVQGLQNALFLSPFATLFPARQHKNEIISASVLAQIIFGAFAGAVSFVGLIAYQSAMAQERDFVLAICFAVGVIGILAREGARAMNYTFGKVNRALKSDLIYGITLLVVVGGMFLYQQPTAAGTMLAMGVAGLLPLANRLTAIPKLNSLGRYRKTLMAFWLHGRWALGAVLVTWVNMNSYAYFVAWLWGVEATADLSAARLLLMPAALFGPAWSNIMRPRFSAWAASNRYDQLRAITMLSLLIGVISFLVYVSGLLIAFPAIEAFFGPDYHGLLGMALAWALYFLLAFSRGVFMATLMVNEVGYRQLAMLSLQSMILTMMGLAFVTNFEALYVIAVLCFVEAIQMLFTCRYAYRAWRGQ